jgi:molybdenum cofactor guanylyltransferase
MNSNADVAGVIIAGGQGSRLGFADKPLLLLNDRPILAHIIARAMPQTGTLYLNVNRNREAFADFGLAIQPDSGGHGPLAGVLAGFEAAARQPEGFRYLACFPGDTPWFPVDTVRQLRIALEKADAEVAWLETSGQLQPLFSLWRKSLHDPVRREVMKGAFSPRYFIESQKHALLKLTDFPEHYFMNINDEESLARARKRIM